MRNRNFYCYCGPTNTILKVSLLDFKGLNAISEDLIKKYKEFDDIDPIEYRDSLLDILILDWKKNKDLIWEVLWDKTDDTQFAYDQTLESIYNYCINMYPDLDISSILSSIESDTFTQGIGEYLKSLYEGRFEEQEASEKAPSKGKNRSVKDLNALRVRLNKLVINQEEAISAIVNSLKLMETGLAGHSSFFFIGPTGNGKTRLATKLAELYFKDRFIKINCGEYSAQHEYSKLVGSPPGYVGHTDKSYLAERAEKSNSWIFLFDEIEKAHHKFYDFLLNLLDEGTVTDSTGRVLDFSRSLFIFTSNKGMQECKIGSTRVGFGREVVGYEESKSVIQDSLKTQFNPEFLNRIDKVIHFNRLSKKDLVKVAKLELDMLPVKKTQELIQYVIDEGCSEEYGGRYLSKFIKNEIAILIADAVIAKVFPDSGNLYTCKFKDGKPFIKDTGETNGNKSKAKNNG